VSIVARCCASLLLILVLVAPAARAQVRFHDAADRDAFRRWFIVLADAQFYRPTPDVADCAALVRHAAREALRSATPDWRRRIALPGPVAAPAPVRATVHGDQGAARIFRTATGPPAGYAEFADARTIVSLNARPLGRDLDALRPGDLLYFRQEGQSMPDHLMVFVGPSAFETDGRDWVVYHTGPSSPAGPPGTAQDTAAGEVRKVRLADLQRHPSPGWRPTPANPRFVGLFRLALDQR
jgi:uncharacterized protein YfaT (DUF1175 family)